MGFLLRWLPNFAPALGPLLNPWVLLAFVVYSGALLGFGGFKGYDLGVSKLHEYVAAQAKAAVAVVTKQGKTTEKVVTKYVAVKGKTQTVTEYVDREVVKYADANPGYCLDGAWRRLHDAAALNAVPAPAGVAAGESGAPGAAAALITVTENYARHHRCADRLDALQEWVTEQYKVTSE